MKLLLKVINIKYTIDGKEYEIPTRIYEGTSFVAMDADGLIFAFAIQPIYINGMYEVDNSDSRNTLLALHDNTKVGKASTCIIVTTLTESVEFDYISHDFK